MHEEVAAASSRGYLIYADDVALAFAHQRASAVVDLAQRSAPKVNDASGGLRLTIGAPECNDLFFRRQGL